MRWSLIVLGVILDLMGIIWMLQGMNVLLGSPMSGQPFWVGAGIVAMLVGVSLIVFGARRPGARPDGSARS